MEPTALKLMVTAHVLATVVWVGGTLIIHLLASQLRTATGDAAAENLASFVVAASRAHVRLLLPAALLLAASGGWLLNESSTTLHANWWVGGSMGLWAVAVFVAALLLAPEGRAIASDRSKLGADAEQVAWRIHRWLMLQRGQLLLLLSALALMVLTPS